MAAVLFWFARVTGSRLVSEIVETTKPGDEWRTVRPTGRVRVQKWGVSGPWVRL